jgi:hypothetical protein
MRTALRGMYGSGVNLVYLAAGIFNPPLGIVQCYGVSTFASDMEQAEASSRRDLLALRSALLGAYRQTRLEPLSGEMAYWIARSLNEMPYAIVTVGHPDPRENARGGEQSMRDPLAGSDSANPFSLQQNELLFRGMSSLQEEFLFMLPGQPRAASRHRAHAGRPDGEHCCLCFAPTGRAGGIVWNQPAGILTGGLSENASHSYGVNHATGVAEGKQHRRSRGK